MARKTTLKQVETKIRELEALATMLKRVEKAGVKELRAVVTKFKLSPADIKFALKGNNIRLNGKGPAKGTKLKPKYRNPAKKSETWAGRGLKPKWVVEALKQGRKLEDLTV